MQPRVGSRIPNWTFNGTIREFYLHGQAVEAGQVNMQLGRARAWPGGAHVHSAAAWVGFCSGAFDLFPSILDRGRHRIRG